LPERKCIVCLDLDHITAAHHLDIIIIHPAHRLDIIIITIIRRIITIIMVATLRLVYMVLMIVRKCGCCVGTETMCWMKVDSEVCIMRLVRFWCARSDGWALSENVGGECSTPSLES
jgi:hypothetical protein